MRERINHRKYPRGLQGVPVTRAQLDALHARLSPITMERRAAQRPLIDLLAEAYMMGAIDAGQTRAALQPKEPGDE